ncbi:site-specific integrase [Dyadobacter sp. CY312]|uniref:tyrosine-type recombinase/integrase n=1 Tax=Dyadobacter sp. CY312 TaxID=2907303 RepID=UPI001F432058|nr:site-specific integrase [Dyadobacter sp. CY312]MCE7043960.1 site-specific integrase [Dyadobacter sp. CY312]
MGIIKPTFKVVLDERREKAEQRYPLKLRVTYDRRRKYYKTGLDMTKVEFGKLPTSKLESLKDIRLQVKALEVKAENVYKALVVFTFEDFEKAFFSKKVDSVPHDVYSMLNDYVKKLEVEGRVSTSQSYDNALVSLRKYKPKLKFEEVTPDFLDGYERKMIADGKSRTTVGIYLRSLRTVYNQAIDSGVVKRELYPFKKTKFQIPAGENVKKALTLSEIEKVFRYSAPPASSMDKAKDFWIFSYLCCGLNLKDICRLRYNQIDGNNVRLVRAKTQLSTKSNQKWLTIYLPPAAKEIIDKWGVKNAKLTDYIFDVLKEDITPQRERELVKYFTKLVNKYMKKIGEDLKISKPITSYTARHSYATVLKWKGVSVEYISETLGHTNTQTTQSYLDSFEDGVKSRNSLLLTEFDPNIAD